MSTFKRPSFLQVSLVLTLLGFGLATLPALARGEGGGGRDGGGRGERGLGRFLPPASYLDLTEEQKAAAQTIRDLTKAALEPLMDNQRALRGQLRDAVTAANPDPTVIGNLTLQIHANRDQFKVIFEKAEADFVALLNADQKAKYDNFRELREQRREHRRERWSEHGEL